MSHAVFSRDAADVDRAVPLTLCEAFERTAQEFSASPALRVPGGAVELTWAEYRERAHRIATGLRAAGIARGDTVALMLTNRPEAMLLDTAAMLIGAIPVSVYNTSSPQQLTYLLTHSGARMIATEAQFAETVQAVVAGLPHTCAVIRVDGTSEGAVAGTLDELEAAPADPALADAWRAAGPEDVATVIYTSGTTGPPKGVELTHACLVAEWALAHQVHPTPFGGRVVSYLPMAHLADRVAGHYAAILTGASVTCVDDPRAAIAALPEIRPTTFMAVPRIWEKLRAALLPMVAQAETPDAKAAIGAQVRQHLGLDEVQLLLSGAAPIAPEVLQFFADLGLEIYEVWGMTETSAAATISPRGAHRVGTVGKAFPGVEVTLADDGELLVRGPIVMRGYRNDPAKTAEAIDSGGWMHTGDIGTIDEDGYVRVVDRKKELIINAAGKNMSPANIENALKAACPLIGSAVAIGDRRPYNVALITLDEDAAAAYAAAQGIEGPPAADPRIAAVVEAGIAQANQALSRVEQIKRHRLLPDPWQPGGDELTPTMKLRRRVIAEKYAGEIAALYE